MDPDYESDEGSFEDLEALGSGSDVDAHESDVSSSSQQDEQSLHDDEADLDYSRRKKRRKESKRQKRRMTLRDLQELTTAELLASHVGISSAGKVEEILEKAVPPASRLDVSTPLNDALKEVWNVLLTPGKKKASPTSLRRLQKHGKFPSFVTFEDKWLDLDMSYVDPSEVQLIGTWHCDASVVDEDGQYTVELGITVPGELLQPRDFIEPRWLLRASHYSVRIAEKLKKHYGSSKVLFSVPADEDFLNAQGPKLHVADVLPGNAKLEIRFLWPDGFFHSNRYSENALQDAIFRLNSSGIQRDLVQWMASKKGTVTADSHGDVALAAHLIAIWARNKGYARSLGPTGKDIWAYVAFLAVGGQSLAYSHMGERVLVLWRRTLDFIARAPKANFKACVTVQSRELDLFAGIPSETLQGIAADAFHTLLDFAAVETNAEEDMIESTFSQKLSDPECCDSLYKVELGTRASVNSLAGLYAKALSDRISTLHIKAQDVFLVDGDASQPKRTAHVLLRHTREAGRLVDLGPAVGDEEGIEAFDAFWGPRASLNRFSDGRILKCVKWDDDARAGGLGIQRGLIIPAIVQFVTKQHIGKKAACLWHASAMDHFVVLPRHIRDRLGPVNSTFAEAVYDRISRDLRNIQDPRLKTAIVNVWGTSPYFRRTNLFAPTLRRPQDRDVFWEPLEVLIAIQHQYNWPSDALAMQKTKAYFLSLIGSALQQNKLKDKIHLQGNGHAASARNYRIRFDMHSPCTEDNVCLEVYPADGYALRIRLASPYDSHLRQAAQYATKFSTVQQRYGQTFSLAVRILERWFSAHMIHHVSHVTIELLVAKVLMRQSHLDSPSSVVAQTWRLLQDWDWEKTPLVVSLEEVTRDLGQNPLRLQSARDLLSTVRQTHAPKMTHAWVIVTDQEPEGLNPKIQEPLPYIVANRVSHLAQSSLAALNEKIIDKRESADLLLKRSTKAFPLVLELDEEYILRRHEAVDRPSVVASGEKGMPVSGFLPLGLDTFVNLDWDPVDAFVRELEQTYGSVLTFFYDKHGGSLIGAVWAPSASSAWAYGDHGLPLKPTKDKSLVIDKETLLRDIAYIGSPLVKKVYAQ